MNAASPHLLLVDDHALYLTGLRMMLAEAWPHADVRFATTWAEALVELREQAPDLVLLDVHLPDAHGLNVLPELLAMTPGTPVLIMSADLSAALVRQARESGACGYLHKSVMPTEVVAAVQSCLQGGQAWGYVPYAHLTPDVSTAWGQNDQGQVHEPLPALSSLQITILQQLSQGVALKSIAQQLHTTEVALRAELSWVTETLGASSREEAVERAVAQGLLK